MCVCTLPKSIDRITLVSYKINSMRRINALWLIPLFCMMVVGVGIGIVGTINSNEFEEYGCLLFAASGLIMCIHCEYDYIKFRLRKAWETFKGFFS